MRTTDPRATGFALWIAAACASAISPGPAYALTLTPQDCREGAEFIGNAARARDNGMPAQRFIARLDEDLVLIRAYPPALRWFARDDEDAAFLRKWVLTVFERPASPGLHGTAFQRECSAVASRAME